MTHEDAALVFKGPVGDYEALKRILSHLNLDALVNVEVEGPDCFFVDLRDKTQAAFERATENVCSVLRGAGLRVVRVRRGAAHRRRLVGLRVCRKKSEWAVRWAPYPSG